MKVSSLTNWKKINLNFNYNLFFFSFVRENNLFVKDERIFFLIIISYLLGRVPKDFKLVFNKFFIVSTSI